MKRSRNVYTSIAGSALPALIGVFATVWLAREAEQDLAVAVLAIWTVLGLLTLTDFGLTRTASKLVSSGQQPMAVARALSPASILAGVVTTAALAMGLVLVRADTFMWPLLILPLLAALQFPLLGGLEAQAAFRLIAVQKLLNAICVYAVPTALVVLHPNDIGIAQGVAAILIGRLALFGLLAFEVRKYGTARPIDNLVGGCWKQTGPTYWWIALSSILGPALLYVDRFALALADVSPSTWISYVALSELLMKTYILPSSVMAVVFPWLVGNLRTQPAHIYKWLVRRLPMLTLTMTGGALCIGFVLPDWAFQAFGIDVHTSNVRAATVVLLGSTVFNWSSQAYIGVLQAGELERVPAIAQLALAVPYGLSLFVAAGSGNVVSVAVVVLSRVVLMWAALYVATRGTLRRNVGSHTAVA